MHDDIPSLGYEPSIPGYALAESHFSARPARVSCEMTKSAYLPGRLAQ